MGRKKFFMIGSTYKWRHLSILSMNQRPISLLMLLSTPEQRKDMAPVAQRERADMYLALNPRFVPQKPTAVLSVFEIMVY